MAVTVITHHVLRDDTAAREWDAAMYERLSAARSQPGWIGGQLLRAVNDRMLRTIVGTWESRDAWETWHGEDAFRETRERLVLPLHIDLVETTTKVPPDDISIAPDPYTVNVPDPSIFL